MNMSNFLLGFLVGAVVVDFLWAWKMGIIALVWSKISRIYNRIFR
jgi:hypothetical protein